MKSTVFAAAAALAAAVRAAPVDSDCYRPGPVPCNATGLVKYTVRRGDILTNIAKTFNSGICDIARYNGVADANLILENQELIIPANCAGKIDNDSCLGPKLNATGTDYCVAGLAVTPPVYIAIPNDTFTKVANNFNLRLDVLEAFNKQAFPDPNVLLVNQSIAIPVCPNSSCTNQAYTIKSGDTFFAISQQVNITLGQIEAANPRQIPENLVPGQVINAPTCKNNTVSA